jgi:glutamine amidotransferase
MGWNDIVIKKPHYILKDIKPGSQVYFVHSFYPVPKNQDMVIATCEYGLEFPCAIGTKNLFATQFHPEKSGPVGLSMLKNFATWEPVC